MKDENEQYLPMKREDDTEERTKLFADHARFINQMKQVRTKSLIDPLRELVHMDNQMATEVWCKLFPIAWEIVPAMTRGKIAQKIVHLLSSPWLNEQPRFFTKGSVCSRC
jgi:hypothetical protein